MSQSLRTILPLLLAMALAACSRSSSRGNLPATAVTSANHAWFPITPGSAHALGRKLSDGTLACESCHAPSSTSFKQFDCTSCHGHEKSVTDMLHLARQDQYTYSSSACYSCHANGNNVGFSHFGITANCAKCHDTGAQFAALPKDGFTHPATGGADCGSCHNTST